MNTYSVTESIDLDIQQINELVTIRNKLNEEQGVDQRTAHRLSQLGVTGLAPYSTFTNNPSDVNFGETLDLINSTITKRVDLLLTTHPENQAVINFVNDITGVSTEGFLGAAGGVALGYITGVLGLGGIAGAYTKSALKQKEKELEALTKELNKLILEGADEAQLRGEITEEEKKMFSKLTLGEAVGSFVLGTVFAPIYNAITSSKIENRIKEIKKKKAEIEEILMEERKKQMATRQS